MLIKIKGKHENIRVFEAEKGFLVKDLNGKTITVIGKDGPVEKELERINRLQGIRMKKTGEGIPHS